MELDGSALRAPGRSAVAAPRSDACGRLLALVFVVCTVLSSSVLPGSADDGGRRGSPASPDPALQGLIGPDPQFFVPRSAGAPADPEHPSQNPVTPWEAIDRCIRDELAAKGGPGAAVAVYQDGEIVYEQGYGTRMRGGAIAVDASTQFRIGSITKMFTAAAVMQEVDAGRVDLRAPITRYIADLRLADADAAGSISVWNLLTHSSGYPDTLFLDLADIDGPKDDAALGAWVSKQTQVRLQSPPGTPEFNAELAKMNLLSWPVIALPSTAIMMFALWKLLGGITRLTGMPLEEIFHPQPEKKR